MRIPDLNKQNRDFANGGGVSANNREHGFIPAFKEANTERVELSRFRDGRRAPIHTLEGLPEEWVVERGANGEIVRILDSVIAGFVRDDVFFTREQAAQKVAA
ncbi:MAG: hypothetical protein OEQ18_09600 [Gammaproteobacteria bacterium]|nr:hypothetical protein [Gammaproteobacteria bacterium]